MCRLFGYVAPAGSSAAEQLGGAGVDGLRALARLHRHGWGWAGVSRAGDVPRRQVSARPARVDPEFGPALDRRACAAMVHLRWATPGMPVLRRNAHPFLRDGVAFEHNGTIAPTARLHALLSEDERAGLRGDTDSEAYFALVLRERAAGVRLSVAAAQAADRLREVFPTASLNAILLDRAELVVVHAAPHHRLPRAQVEGVVDYDDLPRDHNDDYSLLRCRRGRDGAVVVGSTGIVGDGWVGLEPESVTSVALDTAAVRTVGIAATVAAVPGLRS